MPNIVDDIKQKFGATQLELSKYVKIQPIEREDRKGFVTFGEGNMFPQYLIELYNESPVHGSVVNSISFMIAGTEFIANNPQATNEIKRLNLDSILHSTALDLKLHGGFYWEVIWSMDRKTIAQVNHLPFENCRLACSDDNDDITGIYYSRDWNDTRKKKNIPSYIPMFNAEYKDECPVQVLFVHSIVPGSEYYPKPDYIGSINYIELTRQISEYHVNNILNGFFPSLIASFNNGIPSLEEQRMIKNQLQQSIQGAENAGKVLTFFNEERDRGVDFTAFPISDADKQYEFLSEESTKQILIAHRVTSPLLFGIRDGGGLGSNTDELKQAMWIFNKQVIEPFQRMITRSVEFLFSNVEIISDVSIVANDLIYSPDNIQPTTQIAQKKKVECQHESVSKIDAIELDSIADALIELGEEPNEDWILLDSYEVDYENDDIENEALAHIFDGIEIQQSTSTGTAKPNAKSDQDKVINGKTYYTRYRYSGRVTSVTRPFCSKMLSADKLYRKEDILAMNNKAVNPGWGPNGANTYSCWLYKGGGNCHHIWQKELYISAKGFGLDLNNPNVQKKAWSMAEKAGYKIRNNYLVEQRPIDMPYNGFLPDNPRFGIK